VHNLNYWRFGDYLGVGAGAHGKLTQSVSGIIVRTTREREPRRFLARGSTGPPLVRQVPSADLPYEFMMNCLRLLGGFEQPLFEARTGLAWDTVAARVQRLAERGLLERSTAEPDRWHPTDLGLRFLNDLITEFLPTGPVV
jgi:coproporphyrinogen III oxidase-like Fe-S oxidoreductase